MKYDDASWHIEPDSSDEMPPNAGAVHIGMFLAWAIYRGLAGSFLTEEFAEESVKLQNREFTPGQYVMDILGGHFQDEDLNDEGNAFAQAYYRSVQEGSYLDDYFEILNSGGQRKVYAVADTWENFDKLYPRIDQRYLEWRNQQGQGTQ